MGSAASVAALSAGTPEIELDADNTTENPLQATEAPPMNTTSYMEAFVHEGEKVCSSRAV